MGKKKASTSLSRLQKERTKQSIEEEEEEKQGAPRLVIMAFSGAWVLEHWIYLLHVCTNSDSILSEPIFITLLPTGPTHNIKNKNRKFQKLHPARRDSNYILNSLMNKLHVKLQELVREMYHLCITYKITTDENHYHWRCLKRQGRKAGKPT